jgi:L-malate glycosyltransferase
MLTRSGQNLRLFMMMDSLLTGGSERQFALMAGAFRRASLDLYLGCIQRRGRFLEDLGEIGEYPLGGSFLTVRALRSYRKLVGLLRRTRVDVAQSFDFYTNLMLVPAARLAGVPVVVTSQRQLGDLLTPMQRRFQNCVFRLADCVVCNSLAAAERLATSGVPREKLTVIGNALPSTAFVPSPPALPRRPDTLRVGMVARMNALYKNHASFLRIAAQIHQRMPDVEFLLVGDGPLRPKLQQQADALDLGGRAIFLGDRADIPAVLASMDVAVLTSKSESLSNVILEAMAARLPVVAYQVGGNAELVNDQRGMLVDPQDEQGFANAVQRLLSNAQLREQQGNEAHHFVEENFNLDRVCRRYEDLYLTLLQKKCRRKPAP